MMIQTQITHDQATKLAAFINALRPEWDKPGVLDAIAKARTRGTACEVSVAAIRCATSANARTPAVIAMDGQHWREPEPHTPTRGPITSITGRCDDCGHLHPPEQDCPARPMPVEQRERAVADARDQIRAARHDLCAHGVRRADCADHKETSTDG